jgi:RHS repeat-associated protein
VITNNVTNYYQFTGYEKDSDTGYYYAVNRLQSPSLGRFLSPDLVPGIAEDPQTWNRYSYVRNSSLNHTDPLGLMPQCFVILGTEDFPGRTLMCIFEPNLTYYYPEDEANTATKRQKCLAGAGPLLPGQTRCPCEGKKGNFIDTHLADATSLASQLGNIPVANVLGLAAFETRYGQDPNAVLCNNFFSIHPGAKGSTGPCQLGHGGVVSGFPASSGFLLSGQYFVNKWGGAVYGITAPSKFAAAIPKSFNSRVAPLGNPNFDRDVTRTIAAVTLCLP